MKCFDCAANWPDGTCKASLKPRMLVSGHYGCRYNTAAIKQRMKDNQKPTNADRIRAMSDEELAVQLVNEQVVIVKQLLLTFDKQMLNEYETEVKKEWDEIVQEKLAWLRREAEK